MKKILIPLALSFAFAGPAAAGETHDAFFANLKSMCGFNFKGKVVEDSLDDPAMADAFFLVDVVRCRGDEIDMKLTVGDDSSLSWVVKRTEEGLTFHHVRTLEDGSEDAISGYGGASLSDGSANSQAFPADEATRALFMDIGITAAADNTWVLSITPGDVFSYRLERPGRSFEIDFDLHPPVFDGL